MEALSLGPSGQTWVRIACHQPLRPAPGQAVLALQPNAGQALRSTLFPARLNEDGFTVPMPEATSWAPGDELDLLGPVGSGFRPPAASRRWFLVSLEGTAERLLPLIDAGLETGAAVSLWARQAPAALPAAVEMNPDPSEAAAWADYIALDFGLLGAARLRESLGVHIDDLRGVSIQALFASPLPCAFGACQACAVKARRGWKLACQDGPVFDLEGLAW